VSIYFKALPVAFMNGPGRLKKSSAVSLLRYYSKIFLGDFLRAGCTKSKPRMLPETSKTKSKLPAFTPRRSVGPCTQSESVAWRDSVLNSSLL
jgi:hypothetical protein